MFKLSLFNCEVNSNIRKYNCFINYSIDLFFSFQIKADQNIKLKKVYEEVGVLCCSSISFNTFKQTITDKKVFERFTYFF